jgi:DNA-binding transcriptional ArsR family regulator
MDAQTFSALAEPNRLRIVELLREHPCSVGDIAEQLQLRQPQASKHLHTLNRAGLVYVQPVAQQRIYVLNPEPFLRLDDWVNSFERSWEGRLGKLEAYVQQLKERQGEEYGHYN